MVGCDETETVVISKHVTFDESSFTWLEKSDSSTSREEETGSDSESDWLTSSDESDSESIRVQTLFEGGRERRRLSR